MTHPFITHNGGPCPVSATEDIDVQFRDGTSQKGVPAVYIFKEWWEWAEKRRPKALSVNDVVAYRLHQPDNQPTEV